MKKTTIEIIAEAGLEYLISSDTKKFTGDISELVSELRKLKNSYSVLPVKPKKPSNKPVTTSKAARELAEVLAAYELKMKNYKRKKAKLDDRNVAIEDAIQDVIEAMCCLHDNGYSDDLKGELKRLARDGSDGAVEYFYELDELTDLLDKAIDEVKPLKLNIVQAYDADGNPLALYSTYRQDDNVTDDIENAWLKAATKSEHYAENDYEEEIHIPDEAEATLEKKGITRVTVSEVNTDYSGG